MMRGRNWFLIFVVAIGALLIWAISKRTATPAVDFTKVTRETIVSTLATNGKVEPIEWMPVRAERAGMITRVFVARGQVVSQGASLVELDSRIADAEVARAQSTIQQAQAQEQVLTQGGRIAERQQIESELSRARLDLEAAQKDYSALERLAAKQAATRYDLDNVRQRVDQFQLQIKTLEERKGVLVTGPDKEIAKARVQEAQSAAVIARTNLALSVLRAPMTGAIYDFDLKQGSFVNPGDPIAKVGRLDKVRVTVYVDEPDLGKVRKGESVTITWQALAGHQWKGQVDKLPAQIIPLGTRQVGEVGCVIDNPDRDLLPNANIDADIQATVVENTLALPKEAIRRQGAETGVFVLQGDRIAWRKLNLGVSSYTKSQVLSGLAEGDSVALPTEKVLKSGAKVEPMYP
jgi:HlyD family secretion protein